MGYGIWDGSVEGPVKRVQYLKTHLYLVRIVCRSYEKELKVHGKLLHTCWLPFVTFELTVYVCPVQKVPCADRQEA
jgi:hypothetical protein